MGKEIERKYLVRNDNWRQHAQPGIIMRQGYLNRDGACSIRVRVAGDEAYFNIKSATLGISRQEYGYTIPVSDAEEILDTLCIHPLIEKTRYNVEYEGHVWEVDVFKGDNAGLVVAEIELQDEDEAFAIPDWVGEEVSHERKYYNVSLIEHPYKDWSK